MRDWQVAAYTVVVALMEDWFKNKGWTNRGVLFVFVCLTERGTRIRYTGVQCMAHLRVNSSCKKKGM